MEELKRYLLELLASKVQPGMVVAATIEEGAISSATISSECQLFETFPPHPL